jgi:quinoprotein glucose dehydrogenase
VAPNAEWRFHGHDAGSTKSTPLSQIDRENVDDLTLAWRWVSTDFDIAEQQGVDEGRNNQAMPLMVGGVVYTSTPLNLVFALDAATGRELWRFDPGVYSSDVWYPLCFGSAGIGDLPHVS